MRERQRELAGHGNAVIEGRDIGTVVAPDAEVKVYLQADPEIRARRRQAERPDIGADALATDLRTRDESDRVRMQPAEDAELIDTTDLEVDDVVTRIQELIRAARSRRLDRAGGRVGARPRTTWAGRRSLVTRARAYGRDRVPATGGLVYAINHLHWIDVPLVGVVSPRNIDFVAKVEAVNCPGRRPLPALARHDRGAARRVRPRRRAADARGGARRPRRRPLRRRHAHASGRPGPAQPGAAMVADAGGRAGRPGRRLRHAVLEAGRLGAMLGRLRRAASASRACRRAERATRRRPSRSSAASTCSSTGWPTSTRTVGPRGLVPPV